MHRPPPRRLARAVTRAAVVLLASVAVCAGAAPAAAQQLASHEFTTVLDHLPDADDRWSKIGNSGSMVVNDSELLINDNSPGDCIAYQTLLGEIQSGHRATVSARMRVLTNLGGQAVVVEISRPGLELLLELHPDRVVALERRDGREPFWLASANVDLSAYCDLRVTKLAANEDPLESLVVEVDGTEVLRTAGRGSGELGVGRIVFGSLDYPSFGASVWRRIEVSVVPIEVDGGVRTDARSVGALKASYRR